MDLKIVESREGLAGTGELQRAGSTQIQLGSCRTHLDPAAIPSRESPVALALLPFPGVPQGADPTQPHNIPSVHPQTQTHPSAGRAAGKTPADSPRERLPSLGSRLCPGAGTFRPGVPCPVSQSRCSPRCPAPAPPRAASSLPRPPIPAGGAGKALSPPPSPGVCPSSASWQPPLPRRGVSPSTCPGNGAIPGQSSLRKEKSRAKRSDKAGRGQEGKREAKMGVEAPGIFACLLFFLVLGWKGP